MSVHISILCRRDGAPTRRQLCDLIVDGQFFDEDPAFDAVDTREAESTEWGMLEVYPLGRRRPIQTVRFQSLSSTVALTIEEALEELDGRGDQAGHTELVDQIQASRQIFSIEVDPWKATQETWEMFAVVEAFLAAELDGVIYAEEGFYDSDLKVICALS